MAEPRPFALEDVFAIDGLDGHARTSALLDAELPDPRFVDAAYLHWLYDLNPLGDGYFHDIDDEDGTRLAHYGLIPQTYRDAHRRAPFVFSLNAVSRSGAQRRGFFSEIGRRIWSQACDAGVEMVVGVTNANSTWPVKKAGWRVVGPMPVRLTAPTPRPPRGTASYDVTPAFLDSSTFAELADGLDASPAWHWTNCWTASSLRWRLALPHGAAPYSVHVSPELVAVSAVTHERGVPFAVILKLLPRHGRFGPIASQPMVDAICRHHRAPLAVYAGHNRHVPVRGIRLPEKLKPVPLNLVILSLSDRIDQHTFALDTYEFLDMDAY